MSHGQTDARTCKNTAQTAAAATSPDDQHVYNEKKKRTDGKVQKEKLKSEGELKKNRPVFGLEGHGVHVVCLLPDARRWERDGRTDVTAKQIILFGKLLP